MTATVTQARQVAVSVVVPVYNGEAFITRNTLALLRYLADLPGGAELIAVDDGSTDQTPALLAAAAAQAPIPMQVVRHERNLGKGAAILRGMHELRASARAIRRA